MKNRLALSKYYSLLVTLLVLILHGGAVAYFSRSTSVSTSVQVVNVSLVGALVNNQPINQQNPQEVSQSVIAASEQPPVVDPPTLMEAPQIEQPKRESTVTKPLTKKTKTNSEKETSMTKRREVLSKGERVEKSQPQTTLTGMGGESTEVTTPPTISKAQGSNLKPVYPKLSRRLKEEGEVLLLVLVSQHGDVSEVRIKKSSGYSRLDEAAKNSVRKWRFDPARRNNRAIEMWYELPIIFSLTE